MPSSKHLKIYPHEPGFGRQIEPSEQKLSSKEKSTVTMSLYFNIFISPLYTVNVNTKDVSLQGRPTVIS